MKTVHCIEFFLNRSCHQLFGVWTKPHRTKPHTDKTPQDKTPLDKTPPTTGQNPTSFIMYEWIPHNFFIAILHYSH